MRSEDLVHNHQTIGLVEDCPACEQLETDFCWIQLHVPNDGCLTKR